MKKIISIIACLFVFSTLVYSQSSETIDIKDDQLQSFFETEVYKYPNFERAHIFLKNGDKASARVNYNYLLHGLQYLKNKKDTLLLTNKENIKYITISTDTFFFDDAYFEWMATAPTSRLLKQKTIKYLGSFPIDANGQIMRSAKVEHIDAIQGATSYSLSMNEAIEFRKKVVYYLNAMDDKFVEANKENFIAFYPNKAIEQYIFDKKIKFDKEEDVFDLFVFANK
jgi:hypothetical protein